MSQTDETGAAGLSALPSGRVQELVASLPGWTVEDDQLRKEFELPSFAAAMAFVNRVAAVAEAEGHHPDFCVRYARVEFAIRTHAVGGLTALDFVLAAKIDLLARAA